MAPDLWLIAMMLLAALLGGAVSYALLRHWQVTARPHVGQSVARNVYHERR